MIAHRTALFIHPVLGEHTTQVHHAGLGAAIGLLTRSSFQFFFAHGNSGGVATHIQNGRGLGAGQRQQRLALLPLLGGGPHALDQPLNLAAVHLDASGVAQMLLGFLIAGGLGSLEAHQAGQGRSSACLQAQRRVGRSVALFFASVVVVITLQLEGAEDAVDRDGGAPFVVIAWGRLVGGIAAVGRPLQEIGHDLTGGFEDGRAQKHFQFLDGDPAGRVGLKTGHQPPDFLVLGQEELR